MTESERRQCREEDEKPKANEGRPKASEASEASGDHVLLFLVFFFSLFTNFMAKKIMCNETDF